jgi:D-serine deaminase-like pyridoxal phosphate-dependent protein
VTRLADHPTPLLCVDGPTLDDNLAAMAAALPGPRCRPHVKAHKCTALARRQAAHGHPGFTAATVSEIVGLAAAGLGADLLLANEVVHPARLAALAALAPDARVTVAVDSEATVDAAAAAGLGEVVIDVDVGMPRCGCRPADAGHLADRARAAGLRVRGVMGYEGHAVGNPDRAARAAMVAEAAAALRRAHTEVGGELISGGGTGTYDLNDACTEIQAGSYALMDTAYAALDLPFRPAVWVEATVISVSGRGWAVADAGLKALGMDHGNPAVDGGEVWFCSDEHLTFAPAPGTRVRVGDRVRIWPAHLDPTVAYHHEILVVSGARGEEEILDRWPVDLRGWHGVA